MKKKIIKPSFDYGPERDSNHVFFNFIFLSTLEAFEKGEEKQNLFSIKIINGHRVLLKPYNEPKIIDVTGLHIMVEICENNSHETESVYQLKFKFMESTLTPTTKAAFKIDVPVEKIKKMSDLSDAVNELLEIYMTKI